MSTRPPEPWVTKRQLADHLSVTLRWIELCKYTVPVSSGVCAG